MNEKMIQNKGLVLVETFLNDLDWPVIRSCAIGVVNRSASVVSPYGVPVLGMAEDFVAYLDQAEPDRSVSGRVLVPRESFEVIPPYSKLERRVELMVFTDGGLLSCEPADFYSKNVSHTWEDVWCDCAARHYLDLIVRNAEDTVVKCSVAGILAMRVWQFGRIGHRELGEALIQLLWLAYLRETRNAPHTEHRIYATHHRKSRHSRHAARYGARLWPCGDKAATWYESMQDEHTLLQLERAAKANQLARFDFNERVIVLQRLLTKALQYDG